MKAIRVDNAGPDYRLVLADIAKPAPGTNSPNQIDGEIA